MSSRKRRRGAIPAHLLLTETENREHHPTHHKNHQLCEQVAEAISLALCTATSPELRDLYVAGVEPVRGAALLRVLVTTEDPHANYPSIDAALNRALGYLRGEVARAINRKRVPGLELVLAPPTHTIGGES